MKINILLNLYRRTKNIFQNAVPSELKLVCISIYSYRYSRLQEYTYGDIAQKTFKTAQNQNSAASYFYAYGDIAQKKRFRIKIRLHRTSIPTEKLHKIKTFKTL